MIRIVNHPFRRFFTLLTVLVLFSTQAALALSLEQKKTYDSGIRYFNHDVDQCGTGPAASGGGAGLSANVPDVWRNLIMAAAPKYPQADPRMVATVLWVENRGWPEYKASGWSESGAGARGPFQFIPSTWFGKQVSGWPDVRNEANYAPNAMGTDGDGDGVRDPNNPRDAVEAAFKHHVGSMGKPVAVKGYSDGSNAEANFQSTIFERTDTNLLYYAAKYNGRGAPDGVALKNFPRGQNADYVIMAYWLLASDFDKGFVYGQGQVDAKTAGALFSSGGQAPTTQSSPTNNKLYIIGDSITVGMRDSGDLQKKLGEHGWSVIKINALGGKPIDWGIQQLTADRALITDAGAVLIGLGTNNIGDVVAGDNSTAINGAGVTRVSQQMQQLADAVRGVNTGARIFWTDFYGKGTLTTQYGKFNLDAGYESLNSTLQGIANQKGVSVLQWSTSQEASRFVPVNDVHPSGHYPETSDFIVSALGKAAVGMRATSCAGAGPVGQLVGNVSWPVDYSNYQQHPDWFTKPHHDYPAADIPVPLGTNVYSMTAGTIIAAPTGDACGQGVQIDVGNGVTFVYCHGSDGGSVPGAMIGNHVQPGQLIMHSASTGHSTGPHLHVGIQVNGQNRCPQQLFTSMATGSAAAFESLPTSGCTY